MMEGKWASMQLEEKPMEEGSSVVMEEAEGEKVSGIWRPAMGMSIQSCTGAGAAAVPSLSLQFCSPGAAPQCDFGCCSSL